MKLPPRTSSLEPVVEQGRGGLIPTRRYSQVFSSTQYWTVQTSVLNAGVQAQINDINYRIEDAGSLTLQVQAEMAALKGDPRLEAATRALEMATTALIQGLAKQDARFRQEIGEIHGQLVSLSQQVAETQQRQRAAAHDARQQAERGELQVFITQAAQGARLESQGDRVEQRVVEVEQSVGSLTTDDIAEGTKKYFSNTLARGAVSGAGAVAYNATTGLFSLTTRTGWGAATGSATRTTFDTATVTLPQLAERVKALIDDGLAVNILGA